MGATTSAEAPIRPVPRGEMHNVPKMPPLKTAVTLSHRQTAALPYIASEPKPLRRRAGRAD